MTNTNTAFYRDSKGNIKTLVDNMTQKDMREELNGNGYKVITIMKGEKTIEDLERKQLDRF